MLTNIVTSKHTVLQFFQVQLLLFMELWKQQKKLISTKIYHKPEQNYITKNWVSFVLILIVASVITNWGSSILLQIGVSVITNWGSFFITNWGKCYYNLGQLNYYKLGQVLLHIRAAITNQGNRYYKLGHNNIDCMFFFIFLIKNTNSFLSRFCRYL